MERTADAKARLEALHQPVPKPTKAALAQNKAEEDSRRESSTVSKLMRNFQKHPDVAQASRVGDPTLVDPQVVSATSVLQDATKAMMGSGAAGDKNAVSIETAGKGPLAPDQPAPRSDQPAPENPAGTAAAGVEIIGTNPGATGANANPPAGSTPAPPAEDANELKPNVAADPNELKPNVDNAQPVTAPTQVNEIQPAGDGQAAATDGKTPSGASATADDKDIDAAMSSSKHKKKKGLRKVVPF